MPSSEHLGPITHAHVNEWDRFVLYARTFREASEYAAEKGWWLHCWNWKQADYNEIQEVDLHG